VGKLTIPGYEIVEHLSTSSDSIVWLAVRTTDGANVALKFLIPRFIVYPRVDGEVADLVQTLSRLMHPNVVAVSGNNAGKAGRWHYYEMDYCAGGSLASLLEENGGRLSLDRARPIMLQTLQGLAYLHQEGFVHRNVRPEHILLTAKDDGVARVGGFAWPDLVMEYCAEDLLGDAVDDRYLTFVPKEQLVNCKHVKPVTDVWAAAAVFYFAITGAAPRDGSPYKDPLEAVLKYDAVPILERHPGIPAQVANVIDRALAVKQEDRYETASKFLRALEDAFGSSKWVVTELDPDEPVIAVPVDGYVELQPGKPPRIVRRRTDETPATVRSTFTSDASILEETMVWDEPAVARCAKCGSEFEPGVEIDLSIESLCKSCAKQHKLSHDLSEILRRLLKDVPQVAPIPGYTVVKLLAQWGMESMYLATRDRDGAKVAIKVMLARAWVREREREYYQREIDVSMALKHPNIVRCYQHGCAGSTLFLVMELCEGGSVDGLMNDFGGKLPVDIARPIMLQSLEGLAYEIGRAHV